MDHKVVSDLKPKPRNVDCGAHHLKALSVAIFTTMEMAIFSDKSVVCGAHPFEALGVATFEDAAL